MYCSMLLPALWGGPVSVADRECEDDEDDTCMQPNWLRRLSYCRGEGTVRAAPQLPFGAKDMARSDLLHT